MKRIYSSVLLLISLLSGFAKAQNTAPDWSAIFQGKGDNSDRFNKIIPDGSGNFIGVGYTIRPANYRDFLTIKFNSNGDTLWWKTKNGSGKGDDEAITAGVDASGNVFVAGYSNEGLTQNDIRIIKYDPNGIILWDTLWNSPASLDDIPVDLKIDGNGNCIIAGVVKPDTASQSRDFITLKYDPNGVLLWSRQYSNPAVLKGKDECKALTLDVIGDVYVTGRSFNGSNDDFVTIKYDGNLGSQIWLRNYDTGGNDQAVAMVIDHAGNLIVTGEGHGGSNYDYRTLKYDSAGSFLWTKSYNAPANQDDKPIAVGVDASDNVIVTGMTDVDLGPNINYDFQTIKYDSTGTILWAIRTGNVIPQNDEPTSMVVDASGNIFITGKTDQNISPLATDNDFMTVKYNSSGNIQWSGPVYHAGSKPGSDDLAACVILDGANILVAGVSINNITQKDATIVRYDVSNGSELLVKNYNGEGDFNESVKSVVIDSNNNSYVAGYSFSENNKLDACMVKVDPVGNVVCTYQYSGIKGDDDEFNSLAIAPNGSVYAAGYTKVSGEKSNMLLVKWNPSSCDTAWTRTYDFIKQSDKAIAIVLDAAGNIYLTGRSDSNPVDTSDNVDIITIKYDSNGNIIWSQRFNGAANMRDEPVKIILDNNGDVIVGGRSGNIHDDDFLVIKYNSVTGVPVWGSPITWASQYANDDRVNDIAVDAFNNIFVGGFAQRNSGISPQDAILLKYASDGTYLNGSFIIGDAKDEVTKIAVDMNNNLYALYKFDANPDPTLHNYDFLLRKFNNGIDTLIYEKDYDGSLHGDDVPSDLIINPSGDVYVTGSSVKDTSAGRVNKNWLILGYDDSGAQIFISNYDGPNATDDSPNALAFRGNYLWACGYTEGSNNNQKDITVINYNLTGVGVNELYSNSPSSVYPNPFHSEAELVLTDFDSKNQARLQLFDILGKAVTAPQSVNEKSIHIHRGNLASGIYEYRVSNNTAVISRGKLIIN